ncbi:hypothetical protein D3C86_1421700 [compost metagenome]
MADVEKINEFNDSEERRVEDHQPQFDLAATTDDAEHTVEKRINGHQEYETAFDHQHHGFQVPGTELEALVAFLGDQPGGDQHQDLDEGRDQRKEAIEQDGLGARNKTGDDPGECHGEHQEGRLFEQRLLASITHLISSNTSRPPGVAGCLREESS